jgi:hypothetical protein
MQVFVFWNCAKAVEARSEVRNEILLDLGESFLVFLQLVWEFHTKISKNSLGSKHKL